MKKTRAGRKGTFLVLDNKKGKISSDTNYAANLSAVTALASGTTQVLHIIILHLTPSSPPPQLWKQKLMLPHPNMCCSPHQK